jgi:hypothetical protein
VEIGYEGSETMIEYRLDPHGNPIQGVPGPIPSLKIQAYSRGRVEGLTSGQRYLVVDAVTTVSLNGVVADSVFFEAGPRYGDDVANSFNQEAKWMVRFPRYLLEAVETTRAHDVQISVSVELRYWLTGAAPHETLRAAYAHLPMKISQKDWLDTLAAMGYKAGWVLEIERPEVEGWDGAVAFLSKAADRVASRDPEAAIAQCRAAWKQLEPFLKTVWSGIETEVDRGSTAEKDYPRKAERIAKLRDGAIAWANTGDHPENYAASMDDALLAYRLTVSMMSFLSRKAGLAVAHSTSKGAKP